MIKEQALEKKLEQTKWQFPNHVVFKKDDKVYRLDPTNNFDEKNVFMQTGLKVYKEKDGNVALYDPEYFGITLTGDLNYKGTAIEKIPQPINLKDYKHLFWQCKCGTVDLSDWDFGEVISMREMFSSSEVRTVILGHVNLSMCEDFRECFCCSNSLEELLIGDYKILPEAIVDYMFGCCVKMIKKYGKTKRELEDIFKSGQWSSLRPVERMEAFE